MKELLSGWLQPVLDNPAVSFVLKNHFLCGVIAGVALVLLLRFIWWLCRRKGSCRVIEVANGSGNISISSNAVFSVIKNAAKPIKCLQLKKMVIRKTKNGYDFLLKAALDSNEEAAPQIMDKLVIAIRSQMNSVFAVDNIDNIKLNIVSCRSDDGEEFADGFDDVEHGFVDAAEHSEGKSITLRKP